MMRWKLIITNNDVFVLFRDGVVVAASEDLDLVISFYGEITGQTAHALVS